MPQLSPEDIDTLARKRAGAKMGWYIHVTVYVVVNVFLFLVSDRAFGHRPWSVYSTLGWGLGVVLHGVSVFMMGGGSAMRERMIEKERERLRRQQDGRP
jgi:hypothetical protein